VVSLNLKGLFVAVNSALVSVVEAVDSVLLVAVVLVVDLAFVEIVYVLVDLDFAVVVDVVGILLKNDMNKIIYRHKKNNYFKYNQDILELNKILFF
jgi:hypothetical protein